MQTRAELEQENAQIRAQLLAKDAFIDQLKEALILERNRQFAKATESLRSLQSELFDESEVASQGSEPAAEVDDDPIDVPAHKRKRSGRQKLPEDLPRIDVVHDLSEEDKVCPHDGQPLKEIGAKTSEQLDIIPMQIQVIRHIRKQYACPCCEKQGEGYLKTVSKPKQAIEKSPACWPTSR